MRRYAVSVAIATPKRLVLLPLAVTMFAVSAWGQALQGTVTDRNTGQPISGTGIFLCTSCGAMTTTDANGQYSLTAAQLGNRQSATLLFQAQGYFVAQVSYTITTTPTTLNVTLLPGGSVVQGTITDSATGAPIVGASVGVSNNAQTMNGLSTTSGAGGQYSIDSSKLMEASAGGFNSSGLFVSGLAGYFNYLGPAFQVGPPYPVTQDAAVVSNGTSSVITVTTNPPGLNIAVDGTSVVAPQTFDWRPNNEHTIATITPQSATPGTRYSYSRWSDGGALSHTIIVPNLNATYAASFNTQYAVNTAANPIAGGTVTGGGWLDAGSTASITAAPNLSYRFTSFSGDLTGTANPQNLLVDGPKSVVANFSAQQASNTTTLVSSLNPSIAGQLVTFTATVAPSAGTTVPTGTASFIDGSTTLSTVGLDASGQAEYSTSGLALGSHQITVQYSGDANFTSSSSTTLTQVVNTYVPVTLTVSSLADDNTPGTLRSAIGAAHTGDTISFSVSGTITLTQGELDIEKDLIISGPGAANLTISGNNASRVFLLDSGVTANITGITISSGNSNGSPNGALGGGILIDAATLMVNNSTFSGNFANYGGGIYNAGGSVTVTNSTFSGNSATAVGAGFLNQGTVNVTNNTFFNNFANYGGGIYNGQTATVTNSTFVGNYGQSIYNEGMITLKNTILANSGSGSAGIPLGNCVNNSTFISDGHNLSDDPSCSSFFTATGDLNNTPAGFDPRGFQDYGGPTFTLALQSTSPAVDAIPLSPTNDCMDSTGNPITTDQRGVARPQGAACDIGAYELDRVLTLPTLVSSTNPSVAGAAVTFTATVSPRSGSGTPTGIVTFYDGATNIGGAPLNGSSKASLNNSGLSSGTHSITAVYSGDAAFAASTSAPLTQIVKAASSISVGSSLNPSAYGQSVTFTATVTASGGVPTGTVTFSDGASTLGTGALNGSGQAKLSTVALSAGSHTIIASYGGDSNFAPATSNGLNQAVNRAGTSMSISSTPNPSTYGRSVTLTASISSTQGTPTGTVTFYDGAAPLGNGTLNSSGLASVNTSGLGAGAHTLTGVYGGDSNFTTSTSAALGQTVSKATTLTTLTSSPNPSTMGQAITFVAAISGQYGGAVTGNVTFKDGKNTVLGTSPILGGTATLSISTLGTGAHSITGIYSGDGNSNGSTSAALSQNVVAKTASTTTLSSSPNPSTVGALVTFRATASPSAATGTVTFKQGQTVLGTGTLTSGQATLAISSLSAGSLSITAVYGGDTQYLGSTSAALTQVVNKASTTTLLASTPNPSSLGQSVTFTATVSSSTGAIPNGTVTFNQGGTTLGTATLDSTGKASFSTPTLSKGKNNIKAVYAGSSAFSGSTSAVISQVVQ